VINVIPAGKSTVAFAVELASMISSLLLHQHDVILPSPLQKTSRVSPVDYIGLSVGRFV
jgi:hypothetical protein